MLLLTPLLRDGGKNKASRSEGFKLLYDHIQNAVNPPPQADCFFVRFVCFLFVIASYKDRFRNFSSQILGEFNSATNVNLRGIY